MSLFLLCFRCKCIQHWLSNWRDSSMCCISTAKREMVSVVHLIEARWRMATSRAWTESRGTCSRPLTRVSCSRRHDTLASQRMDTLKMRSFPSPGMVTSKSTWGRRRQNTREEVKNQNAAKQCERGWTDRDTYSRWYSALQMLPAYSYSLIIDPWTCMFFISLLYELCDMTDSTRVWTPEKLFQTIFAISPRADVGTENKYKSTVKEL